MLNWIIVIALIGIGLGFIIVEILFVPGTTVVGIVGLVAAGLGVYLSFVYFGASVGLWILIGTGILFTAGIYLSFKQRTWDKFSLKDTMQGRFNEGITSQLQIAQQGIAISNLRPYGKAEFSNQVYEVRTFGDYIDNGTEIEIVKIMGNTIYVQPKN